MSATTAAILDTPIRRDVKPFDADTTAAILRDYHRDGFALIRNVLQPDEIAALKTAVDRVMDGGEQTKSNRAGDIVGVRLFETDPVFEEMLTREPFISLAETVLGKDCHLIAQNVIRNTNGKAIDNFHVDDYLFFPLPENVPHHDPRIQMPIFVMTFQILLSDIDTLADGPSEYAVGSHYSGRKPNDMKNPSWNGQPPAAILGKAGDVYAHNGQCWHRGAPVTSGKMRYLFQLSFAQRFVSQRFHPFINYRLPDGLLDRCDDRRKRVLGVHPSGPYG